MLVVLGILAALTAQDPDRRKVGGARLTYRLLYRSDEEKRDERKKPQAVVDVLRKRIASRGLKEARFAVEGNDRIVADITVANREELAAYKELFQRIGKLELRPVASEEAHERWRADPATAKNRQATAPSGYEAVDHEGKHVLVSTIAAITGEEIHCAVATKDSFGDRWKVDFVLTEEGGQKFDAAAKELFNQEPKGSIAIVLDGQVMSMPVVNSEKFGGTGQITGSFDEHNARDLAAVLQGGSLPVALGSYDGLNRRIGEPEKEEEVEGGTFAIPPVTPGKDGWETYEKPIVLSKESVKDLAPGQDSAEAAVAHFYASRIRGDARYEEVLPPKDQWSDSLKRKLKEMGEWTFVEVKLLARKKKDEEASLRLYMKILHKGKEDFGEDEIDLKRIDEKWIVIRPPT